MKPALKWQIIPVRLLARLAVAVICSASLAPIRAQWTTGSGGAIYYNGGNVGIGITAPAGTLEVARPNDSGTVLRIGTVGGNGFAFSRDAGSGALSIQGNQTGYNNILLGPSSGNVGIGTTTPQYKLSVNGTIGTKEVIVTNTGWADFVLKPDYRLPELDQVAAYIREHGRLPGMPSEKEVQEKGVNLAGMQVKLLAKVEELTLHMIEEHKRNRRLEQENRELRADNEAIRERLARLEQGMMREGPR